MSAKAASDVLLDLAASRRSYYALTKTLPTGVTPQRIRHIVDQTTLHVPSSFNSQTNRVVLLLGAAHDKLWTMTADTLKAIQPADRWPATEGKMNAFKGAAGTVLFFTDEDAVEAVKSKAPPYAHLFAGWATQSAGMQEFLVWTALEADGLGASLQHYGPVVQDKVKETWKLPASWTLDAQLVFGGRAGEPGEKAFQPLEERVKQFDE